MNDDEMAKYREISMKLTKLMNEELKRCSPGEVITGSMTVSMMNFAVAISGAYILGVLDENGIFKILDLAKSTTWNMITEADKRKLPEATAAHIAKLLREGIGSSGASPKGVVEALGMKVIEDPALPRGIMKVQHPDGRIDTIDYGSEGSV